MPKREEASVKKAVMSVKGCKVRKKAANLANYKIKKTKKAKKSERVKKPPSERKETEKALKFQFTVKR